VPQCPAIFATLRTRKNRVRLQVWMQMILLLPSQHLLPKPISNQRRNYPTNGRLHVGIDRVHLSIHPRRCYPTTCTQ